MNVYIPDRWMLIKITGTDPHYRVFGSWFGGYLGSDSWRMNSGINDVIEEEDFYIFKGYSGSEYRCYKQAYGAHSYGYGIADDYAKNSGGKMEVLSDMPDVMNLNWRPEKFEIESLDPAERSWYYDGYGKKRKKNEQRHLDY